MPSRQISPIVAAIQAEVRRQGLSVYKVAKLAGVRVYTVQRIMGNKGAPRCRRLKRWRRRLGCA